VPSDPQPLPPAPRIPPRLTWAAAIAVRLLAIGAAALVVGWVLWRLRIVVLPVVVALFLCTVLAPPAVALKRRGWPPLAAAATVFAVVALGVVALVALVVPPFVSQLDDLGTAAGDAVDDVREWLRTGPLELGQSEVDELFDRVEEEVGERRGDLASGALSGATMAAEVVVGVLITLVLTFFFVKDGDRMIEWGLGQLRPSTSDDLRHVGRRAWRTFTGYFRGVTIDGLIEGVLIALGLVVLGVPLALPLGVITFFGGYFPLIGAIVAGALAAAVALVTQGLVDALLIVAWAVVVQNIISNLVDPLVMSRTVRIHPVVLLLAVTTGGVLGGIVGAFVAVPLTAVALDVADYFRNEKPERIAAAHADGDGAGDADG
jgi:predicted PurR-regulated permease PerM